MIRAIISICFLAVTFMGHGGEFSKIDLAVRETIERDLQGQSLDIFEDIYDLKVEGSDPNCLMIVSALVQSSPNGEAKYFLCINKHSNGYQAITMKKE